MSVPRVGHEVRLRPRITSASTSVRGPWQITPGRLAGLEEAADKAHRVSVTAELVRAHGAARHDQGVVVARGDLGEGLLYREGLARVDVAVHGLGFAGLDTHDIDFSTGILDGLLGLGKLDLLATHRGKQYGYLASLQLARHV
jgi:hypothetical protein